MGFQERDCFTPSQTDLIHSTREDILFRRGYYDNPGDGPRNQVFMGIVILMTFFPFIGLLSLWRFFDSTISWYTHGECHRLTRGQRVWIKYQLIAEVVLYPVLIVALAVFYSKHG